MDERKAVRKLIKNAKRVAVFSHVDCDHDSICSCLAVKRILEKNGRLVNIYQETAPPKKFDYLIDDCVILLPDDQEYDLAIVLDLSNKNRLGKCAAVFNKCKKSVTIDHHQPDKDFTDLVLRNSSSSSTCEEIFWLFKDYPVKGGFDGETAKFLYVGIFADTGGFKYSNVSGRTFECLAALARFNNQYDQIVRNVFNTNTRKEFEIIKRGMSSVEFFMEGKIAVSYLSAKDFADVQTGREDGKFLVSFMQSIEGVLISANVTEEKAKDYRISLRTAFEGIDVSKIAAEFGGGGHVRAAGLGAKGEYKKVLDKILALSKIEIEKAGK